MAGATEKRNFFIDRAIREGLEPNQARIVEIHRSGRIPIVAFDPGNAARCLLAELGWTGQTVLPIEASALIGRGDAETHRWIQGRGDGVRALVVGFACGMLMNLDKRGRWSLEGTRSDVAR